MTVFSLDREEALRRVREAAERLGRERPGVRFVGLFGSLAKGTAVPGSDADLIVVLDRTDLRFLDRPLRYGSYFEGVGLDVDLFCYTPDEIPRTPLARSALNEAVPLWGDPLAPADATEE